MIGKLAVLAASTLLLCACGEDDNFALGKWAAATCTTNGVTKSAKPGERTDEYEFKKASVVLRMVGRDQQVQEGELKNVKYEVSPDRVVATSGDDKTARIDIKKDPDGLMVMLDSRTSCLMKRKSA